MKNPQIIQLSESQRRQSIDAETVYLAWRRAKAEAREVRGGMLWRKVGETRYLIRTSTKGAQKSLGAESEATTAIFERFHRRKSADTARLASLTVELREQERLNKALRVGRVPGIVIDTLNALDAAGVGEQFMVVGTHALFAYETSCGVRFSPQVMQTRDIDLLYDTRKRIAFVRQMRGLETSLIATLRKADPTFRVQSDQLQTAVNDSGFEVDVIRRDARDGDPHPLRMSDDEEDFWAVQVDSGNRILSSAVFSQAVASSTGQMAMMRTMDPTTFVAVKRWLAAKPDRDPRKASKDELQAVLVGEIIDEHMLQLQTRMGRPGPSTLVSP